MSIEEVADRLYAMEPEEFTAARDDEAKHSGGDDRKAIKALRKPTVAAYVVNMLAREHRDDVEALVDLGDDLRKAMAGKGDIRELSERRRELVRDLVDAAAGAAGRDLTATVEEDVAATLEAATADPGLGEAVLSGRLVKPLRYAGFGTLPDVGDAVATPLRTPTPRKPKAAATKKQDDVSPAELTRLRTEALELAGAADDAQRRYEQATRAVAEARKLLEQAEAERADAHREASAAHKEADRARRELGKLERK